MIFNASSTYNILYTIPADVHEKPADAIEK